MSLIQKGEESRLAVEEQHFLDTGQYERSQIAQYEAIYGYNFVSTGGEASTRAILQRLTLRPTMLVLDIGCGLGGAAFVMAREYGVTVHGLDLSHNMISLAQERCREAGLADKVRLFRGNCLDFAYPTTYDVVHSRDAFLHIVEKERLLSRIWQQLNPQGVLVFTDYCRGESEPTPEFVRYIEQRQYHLRTPKAYGLLLEESGFVDVQALDQTDWFIQILEDELARLDNQALAPETVEALTRSWRSKIARAKQGQQRWGLFIARKR